MHNVEISEHAARILLQLCAGANGLRTAQAKIEVGLAQKELELALEALAQADNGVVLDKAGAD